MMCLLAYMLVPVAALRLCLLAVLIWMLLGARDGRAQWLAASLLAGFLYVAGFILNPLCLHFDGVMWGELGLVGFGLAWWSLSNRWAGPVRTRRVRLTAGFMALWCVLVLAAYWPSWMADVPYRGDESFHLISVQVRWLMLRAIVDHAWMVVLVIAWMAVTVVCAGKFLRGDGGWGWLAVPVSAGFLVAAMAAPWFYTAEFLANPFVRARLYRYPAAESWLSALLGAAGRENWTRDIFSNEMGRLLSVSAVLCLGFVFGGDRRWRRLPVWLVALAGWGMVTSPNLLFHGAMAYLEVTAILLATVALADGRQWLECPWPRLCRRPSWWAMVLLGFTKETVLPMILAMVGLRALVQWWRSRRAGGWWRREWPVWCGVLAPVGVYVWLRTLHEFRPYPAMFGNYLHLELWWQALSALGRQYGLLVLLAAYGLAVCATGSRQLRLKVALAATTFVAMLVFMMGDYPLWIGIGRFNLLLLPALVTLGWEGLTALCRRSVKLAGVVALALVGTNFLLSPVGRDGQRGAWDVIEERWYPYMQCLQDIQAREPGARLLLANMDPPYAYSIATHQLGWNPSVLQLLPFPNETGLVNLEKSLRFSSETNITVIVYRDEGRLELPDDFVGQGFRLMGRYPAKIGGLFVFERQGPPTGAANP